MEKADGNKAPGTHGWDQVRGLWRCRQQQEKAARRYGAIYPHRGNEDRLCGERDAGNVMTEKRAGPFQALPFA